ncbi:unnamed protein product, partial [Nesidiocoris tenuis]
MSDREGDTGSNLDDGEGRLEEGRLLEKLPEEPDWTPETSLTESCTCYHICATVRPTIRSFSRRDFIPLFPSYAHRISSRECPLCYWCHSGVCVSPILLKNKTNCVVVSGAETASEIVLCED